MFPIEFCFDFFNLLLVKFLQAEIIAMKHLIQGCNNEAWVGVKPSNDARNHSATLSTTTRPHAAVLHQNMIENGKLTRPGQTNSSEKQNSKGTTQLVPLLFCFSLILVCHALAFYFSSCYNEGLTICPKTFSLISVPACYFVNIVQSITVEEVHVHSLKTFKTR